MPKYHPHHLNEDNFKLSSEALAMIIGTAIIAGISGYMIGIASSLGLIPNPFVTKPVRKRGLENYSDEEESGDEDIDEAVTIDHAPNWANGFEADQRAGLRDLRPTKGFKEPVAEKKAVAEDTPSWENSKEDCKLVLVVRTDLGMTKGKIAAQASHATLACYKNFLRNAPNSKTLRRWEREGQAKIAVQVKSQDELETLQAQAMSLGLVAEVIQDAGRTQIEAGSLTVLGIGPAPASVINQVTGHLKLL